VPIAIGLGIAYLCRCDAAGIDGEPDNALTLCICDTTVSVVRR